MAIAYSSDQLDLFKFPSRILVSGYSNSGKSELVCRLIIKYHSKFKKILICGLPSHPLQDHVEIGPKLEVTTEIINPLTHHDPYDKRGILFILDDIFTEAVKNQFVVDSFTKGRHNNISVIFITQNLYMSGKHSRNISLNCSHFLLLRQRDLSQINLLGRQIFGKDHASSFTEIYKTSVFSRPYGYLLVDLGINTPDSLQFRSCIADEAPYERVFQW